MASKRYQNRVLRMWWAVHVEAWRLSGLSRSAWSRLERGQRLPWPDTARRIRRVLGVSFERSYTVTQTS